MMRGRVLWAVLAALGLGFAAGSTCLADINATGSTYDSGGYYYVGYADFSLGTLTINAGSDLNRTKGYVGYGSGSTGTATVTGAGSTWTNSRDLFFGVSGSGTLNIEAGGQVSNTYGYLGLNSGTTGTVTVTGAGSMWTNSESLYVGREGKGTLNIEAGGQVSNSTGSLGLYSGSTGTATVTGAGSMWTNTYDLYVGESGSGTLNIEAGGRVSNNRDGYIGYASTGTATVTGAGSKWTNSGELYVGYGYYGGSGTLRVADGGQVSAGTLYASLCDLLGNGTITVTNGAVLDADLVFDSTHGTTQTLSFGAGGTLNLKVTSTGVLGVGHEGTGTIRIADGVTIASAAGYLGRSSGSTGTATVIGSGSKWIHDDVLYVGYSGSGTLNIEAGGQVVNNGWGSIAHGSGSTGMVTVAGAGSKWTLNGELRVGEGGSGTLTIEAGGQVSNAEGDLGYWLSSSATATVTGVGSMWTNSGDLHVGRGGGDGTLTIEAGGQVNNTSGYVGDGAVGTATVTGSGSKWASSSTLYIGYNDKGTLNIGAGGQVSNGSAYLASFSGSIGTVKVTGAGSKWTTNGILYVGSGGSGTLTVADGGKVVAQKTQISNQSAVRLHVSGNEMLVLGDAATTGSITNDGAVNLYANSFLATGVYTPISEYAGRAMTWSGTGSYKACGGTWDTAVKTFTVVAPTLLAAGASETISSGERLLFTDPASGHSVGASFGSVTGSPTFSAAPMGQDELDALALMPGLEGSVFSAWDFDTNFSGGEVFLSFDIGLGAWDLGVWHYDGGVWQPYAADLMTYDSNGILSLTATDFSGYAVTGIPEPATLSLLAAGVGAIWLRKRRGTKGQRDRGTEGLRD